MNCLHNRAAHWLQQGIFDNLKSFGEFETRVNSVVEGKDRGDIFEIFVEAFLATQSITQRVRHWIVGKIPLELRERYKLPKDGTGIDGIYETHDGTHVAYQVKYRQKSHLTFAEVAPFLGITEAFSDRVIFTNAASLSSNALVRTRWYSGEVFHDLSVGALKQIECWLKEKSLPVVRATPDPNYQRSALADIAKALASDDRATAVMACGTGKTLVALWAAEQADPKTVLVLVPSLTLLQQTLKEWSEHTSWESRFSYLCVCSDQTVDLRNDEINIDKSDVGFRVDTDPAVVREFLSRPTADVKVIFSTYQSSPVVGAGSKDHPPYDFAVFDEAHKTTGRSGTSFSYALSSGNIRISKRLFLTATPRHIDIRHLDEEGEFLVQSMDDPAVYGRRAHVLSFHAAAQKGIICRYKVLISVIDKQMVDDFTRNNGITLVDGDEIAARWVANLIALEQAAKKVDAKKIISFHSRVATAKEFASSGSRGIARYLPEYDVRHVNGTQSSADRSEIIKAFATAEHSLLTNARCLTEGINIPAVDMVAFIDPRQSRIDIAQAVGRAMRKPRGATTKTIGYVLVPLFCGVGGESVEDAIKSERFDGIASVVNALQENDEELVDIIRELKQRKGEGLPFNPKRFIDKIEVMGPHVDFAQLTQSIAIEIADRIGASWDEWYGRLVKYKQREGHCRVAALFTTDDGYRLGIWVSNRRTTKDQLPPERRQRLDELGFVWDPFEQDWEDGLSQLRAYKQREGHCRVPNVFTTYDGYRLGSWVSEKRKKADQLSPERRQQLDELGFVWDPLDEDWEDGLSQLRAYKQREGHCRVPTAFITDDGFRLGIWISTQRQTRDQLSPERRQRLDELGLVWDPFEQDWEDGLIQLRAYKQREGHCRVPSLFTTDDGYRLGIWISHQRTTKDQISPERRQQLDELGFVWDQIDQQWEDGLSQLRAYKKREGDCRVPNVFTADDGYRLGNWVATQRYTKDELSAERRQRLDELGFVWDPFEQDWEDGLIQLRAYKQRVGDCLVPYRFTTDDGGRLGNWVARQRDLKDSMSPERRQRLDELGFVWDPLEQGWEDGLIQLRAYKQREGHCRVPTTFITDDGYRLGIWVATQRNRREQLSAERRQRLDKLGFVWNKIEHQWENGLSQLRAYKQREGHCRVPALFTADDGYRLGNWVANQRQTREQLSPERRQQLDELGFVWDPLDEDWEDGLSQLRAYKQREGHCRVPTAFITDGYRLGSWVANQREFKDSMSAERRQRLDELGFVWNKIEHQWEDGLSHLRDYKQREGHCRVPRSFTTDNGYQLGNWVHNRRKEKDQLSAERRQQLDELGFVWDPLEQDWEDGLSHLRAYKQREGHCRVPKGFKTEDGYPLGSWENSQRQLKDNMPEDRRRKLDDLGFIWKMNKMEKEAP